MHEEAQKPGQYGHQGYYPAGPAPGQGYPGPSSGHAASPMVTGVPVYGADQLQPRQPWITGPCDCSVEPMSCLDVAFCHYCILGKQYTKLTTGVTNEIHVPVCLGAACGDACTGLGTSVVSVLVRMEARRRLGLVGDDMEDIIYGGCCPACSICQVQRQMGAMGHYPGGMCSSEPFRPSVQYMHHPQHPQHPQQHAGTAPSAPMYV